MLWNLYSFESVFRELSKNNIKMVVFHLVFLKYGWAYITKSFFLETQSPQMTHELRSGSYFLAL